jgi:hypothetical protein
MCPRQAQCLNSRAARTMSEPHFTLLRTSTVRKQDVGMLRSRQCDSSLEFRSLKLHSLDFSQSDGPDLIRVILLTSSN